MLKAWLLWVCLLMCGHAPAQGDLHSKAGANIYYRFMYFPHKYVVRPVFHYEFSYHYRQEVEDEKNKKTEVYNYVHNGDNLKVAEDIFTNDIRGGRTWFRNFDVGEFASLSLEVSPDVHNQPGAVFQWTGQVIFFKLFHRKSLGRKRKQ